MKTLLNISLALLAIAILAASTTFADGYDWRQKMTYGNDPTKRSTGVARTYTVRPEVESRRAYSYEPAAAASFKAGDTITVTAAEVQMKVGDRVVATVPQGLRITVSSVEGAWVGANIEQNGKQVGGWILASDLAVSTPCAGR